MIFTHLTSALKSTRPPFLLLAPICIYLAASRMLQEGLEQPLYLFFLLVAGVLAHISVNTFNEYFDFHSGLDALTNKTPFSGGSGALIDEPGADKFVLFLAIVSLAGTILIGIYFIYHIGWVLFPLGITGVVLVVAYTNWVNKSPVLCLFAPGLAFGPLMMWGTELVLGKSVTSTGIFIALVPFFMVNNLLLINQLPDIQADKKVGRVTFPIQFGLSASLKVYLVFAILAALCIVVLVMQTSNTWLWLAILPWTLSLFCWLQLIGQKPGEVKLPAMALNVAASLLTPLVLALALHYG